MAETKGTRPSVDSSSPIFLSPVTRFEMPSGRLFFLKTLATMFWQAKPHKGVFSEDVYKRQGKPFAVEVT